MAKLLKEMNEDLVLVDESVPLWDTDDGDALQRGQVWMPDCSGIDWGWLVLDVMSVGRAMAVAIWPATEGTTYDLVFDRNSVGLDLAVAVTTVTISRETLGVCQGRISWVVHELLRGIADKYSNIWRQRHRWGTLKTMGLANSQFPARQRAMDIVLKLSEDNPEWVDWGNTSRWDDSVDHDPKAVGWELRPVRNHTGRMVAILGRPGETGCASIVMLPGSEHPDVCIYEDCTPERVASRFVLNDREFFQIDRVYMSAKLEPGWGIPVIHRILSEVDKH